MEIIEVVRKVENGKIIIEVPESFNEHEVRVVVSEVERQPVKKFIDMPVEERLETLKKYWGTARYPDYPTSKYDVYEQ